MKDNTNITKDINSTVKVFDGTPSSFLVPVAVTG
jgi:hypothetical protein